MVNHSKPITAKSAMAIVVVALVCLFASPSVAQILRSQAALQQRQLGDESDCAITGVVLLDTMDPTNPIETLTSESRIDLEQVGSSLTIVAETKGSVHSVSFSFDNAFVRTEGRAPYALNGDRDNVYNDYPPLAAVGRHTVEAEAVDLDSGSSCSVSVSFEVIKDEVPPAPVPTLYYSVAQDLRKCASPLCGGFFVAELNQDSTTCSDGTKAKECYVVDLDLSSRGFSDSDAKRFLDEVARDGGLLLGKYTEYTGPNPFPNELANLKVKDGWSPFQASKGPPEPDCDCGQDEVCIFDPLTDCSGCGCPTICVSTEPIFCGGLAGFLCPRGLTCIDNPEDSCDPACGGADCGGICISYTSPTSDSSAEVLTNPPVEKTCLVGSGVDDVAASCGFGLECVDDWKDKCSPMCRKEECAGVCVQKIGAPCGGLGGFPCGPGLVCMDPLGDGCDNQCGAADCGGVCLPEERVFGAN